MFMSKRNLIISSTIILVIGFSLGILYLSSDIKIIERRYDVDLPQSSQVIYIYDDIGWFGEGATMTTVSIESNELIEFYDLLYSGKSNSLSNEELEKDIDNYFENFLRNSSSEYWPNWDNSYDILISSESDSMYYIFDYDNNNLILIEIVY